MSSKHEEKKLIHEILFLLGKILLIISYPLFMLIFFRFILLNSISSDFFDLENLLKPHVHGTLMFFLGFSLYVALIMGFQSSIRKNYFKSMTYPSPIFRKHLCLYSILITELIFVGILLLIDALIVFALWDQLQNPAGFFLSIFFALYLTLRIVYNLFSIIPRTLSIPKSGPVYGSVKGFYFIFFTVLFIPGLVFAYQAMNTGEMGAHWQALNEDYIGRLLLLIPNSAIVLMGQNVGLPAKAWLTLVLIGLHVSTTVIFYILYSNTNSVRWKEGFSFHRRAKKHKKHISSFQGVKTGRGWDIVDFEGLRTFERIPWKVLRRAQNAIFVMLAIFGGYLAFFILFVGMSSWYLLYLLLAAPLIILGTIVINLFLILSSEGLKFFRLIP
ncbi:MAG: hypothetical protein V3U20_09910, partial [Thermoplasmata archaeon]